MPPLRPLELLLPPAAPPPLPLLLPPAAPPPLPLLLPAAAAVDPAEHKPSLQPTHPPPNDAGVRLPPPRPCAWGHGRGGGAVRCARHLASGGAPGGALQVRRAWARATRIWHAHSAGGLGCMLKAKELALPRGPRLRCVGGRATSLAALFAPAPLSCTASSPLPAGPPSRLCCLQRVKRGPQAPALGPLPHAHPAVQHVRPRLRGERGHR